MRFPRPGSSGLCSAPDPTISFDKLGDAASGFSLGGSSVKGRLIRRRTSSRVLGGSTS